MAGYIARRTGCAEATREMDASAEALADPDVTDAAADRYNTALMPGSRASPTLLQRRRRGT